MYTPTVQKKDDMRIVITIDPSKVSRGHAAHRGGSGKHHDRRTNRLRTRSAQRRAALAE